jgi:aryl-alcohol dehydrogenase-like predicted oxidoreductase
MRYNKLTRSLPLVSEIGLGTWQLGVNSGWKHLSEKEAIHMIHKSLDFGVNFFDTAPNYGNGTSELRLGKAFQGMDRSNVIINTKFGHTDSGQTNYNSNYIRQSLEGSLRRLQLDYVDSLMIHSPPIEYLDGNENDHYEILGKLKDEGKIRAYGASLDTSEEIKLLIETTECTVIEAFFNILHQDVKNAFDLALEKEVGIIVKIPFDSGWLTGEYDERSKFNGIRSRWSKNDIVTRSRLVDRLKQIIGREMNLAQVAILFCLAFEAVSTVIPGNTSVLQLESNLKSVENSISKELVDQFETFYEDEVKALNLPW